MREYELLLVKETVKAPDNRKKYQLYYSEKECKLEITQCELLEVEVDGNEIYEIDDNHLVSKNIKGLVDLASKIKEDWIASSREHIAGLRAIEIIVG